MLWGIFCVMLLLGGVFIKIGTYSNFNCGFIMWSSNVSFDGIKLMVLFVIFELEVVVVIMFISGLGILVLLMVTVIELGVMYI